ncbi:MAG: restriction endonuclease subunit S [Bacteroidales bacterium]
MSETFKLRELLIIKNGRDHQHIGDGNIPIYGSGGVMRYGDTPIYNDESILLPRKGSLSNIQYVNRPFWTVDTIYYSVVDKNKCNPYYLYRYLKLLDLSGLDSGTGVPSMTFDSYYNITVSMPELESQHKIASVLSSLDAKIDLNNRIISELEAMSKQLYDYWFVQFDFPNAEGKPYRSSGGKMVYNDKLKREIPEGWEVKKLSYWIDSKKGGDWGKEDIEGNYTLKVACIRGADINGLNGLGECNPPIRFILDKNKNKILSEGDLVVEISGGSPTQSTGRITIITSGTKMRFNDSLICSNFCQAVTLKDRQSSFYVFYMWKMFYDSDVLFNFEGKTSGIKNFLFETFVDYNSWYFPPTNLIHNFQSYASDISNNKENLLRANQELRSLRDWLLPMLMNGQVKVK